MKPDGGVQGKCAQIILGKPIVAKLNTKWSDTRRGTRTVEPQGEHKVYV